jgi:hypothetical protein
MPEGKDKQVRPEQAEQRKGVITDVVLPIAGNAPGGAAAGWASAKLRRRPGEDRRAGRSAHQVLAGAPARACFTALVLIACRFSAR